MKTDLIERLRAHASGHLPLGWTDERMLLEEAAAALEAEASEAGCMCRGVEIGSHMASVSLPIPEHMADYREARVAAGLSPMISVDACLVVELRLLWSRGIRTYGCCCGHNKVRGMINVHEDDMAAMLAMGYEQWPEKDGMAVATFYPKSARGLASEGERRGLERAAEVASRMYVRDAFRFEFGHDVAAAIRALIPEAPATEGWQPISSAPKDGTVVDLWHEEFGRQADFKWGHTEHSCGEAGCYCDSDWHSEEAGWVETALNERYFAEDVFTHWRPLPPPPQDREPDSQRGAE